MKYPIFYLTFLVGSFLFASCNLTDPGEEEPSCSYKAFYQGTNVCFQTGQAAAVRLAYNNELLILENFFGLYPDTTIQEGQALTIDFETVDFDTVPPILCGVFIVAPVTQLNCINLAD